MGLSEDVTNRSKAAGLPKTQFRTKRPAGWVWLDPFPSEHSDELVDKTLPGHYDLFILVVNFKFFFFNRPFRLRPWNVAGQSDVIIRSDVTSEVHPPNAPWYFVTNTQYTIVIFLM